MVLSSFSDKCAVLDCETKLAVLVHQCVQAYAGWSSVSLQLSADTEPECLLIFQWWGEVLAILCFRQDMVCSNTHSKWVCWYIRVFKVTHVKAAPNVTVPSILSKNVLFYLNARRKCRPLFILGKKCFVRLREFLTLSHALLTPN